MNQCGLLDDLSRLSSQSQNAAVLKVKAEEIPTGSAYSPGILEFVNYHLSSLIMFENVKKKIDGSFSYLWDFYKVFFPWFLQYLQKYECRLKVFPLKWDTSWISLLCLSTVFIKDGEILFLLNSKDAFFLLYPSSFSTVRSSPQDTMNWLCGIIGLNRCPFNDSAYESADQFYAIKELIAVKIFPNIWVFIESNFKPSWSLLINC